MKLEFDCDLCEAEYHAEGEEARGLPFLIDCPCGGFLALRDVALPLEVFGADFESI